MKPKNESRMRRFMHFPGNERSIWLGASARMAQAIGLFN